MKTPIFANTNERIRHYGLPGGAAYVEGAAVVLASGLAAECGANPALIAGFAMHDAGALPVTSTMAVSVAMPDTTFFGEGNRAPLVTDIGAEYGLTKDGDGIWYVDTTKVTAVTNTRVRIETVDLTRNLYEFKVIVANRQLG
jgi:hypothetical protein